MPRRYAAKAAQRDRPGGTGPEGPDRTVTPVLGMPNQVFMEEAPPGPKRQRLAFEPRPSYFDEHFLFANTAF